MKIDNIKLGNKVSALLEKYFLPLLLGAVVMNVIFQTYYRYFVGVVTIGFAFYEMFLFCFFEKLKKWKILRFFVYCALGFAVLMGSFYLIGYGWANTGVSFIDWFYVNSQEVGSVWYYNVFLFVGLGFFIISVLYYFTVYRFRIFGVMLVTMFPFVIYGKRSDNISTLNLTIMMTTFLAMMVHQHLVTDDAKRTSKLRINTSYTIAVALFVTFVGAVTMVLPKPDYKSALEEDRGIFRFQMGSNRTDYDDLNDVSSPRFGADSTGEILFYARSSKDEDVIYLRRQSFDVFRNDQWENDDEYYKWYEMGEDGAQLREYPRRPDRRNEESLEKFVDNEVNSPMYIYKLIKRLAETGYYKAYGLTEDMFGKYGEYSDHAYLSLSGNYNPSYIPAPLMVNTDSHVYATKMVHGEVYYSGGYTPSPMSGYGELGVSYSYYGENVPEIRYIRDMPLNWYTFRELMQEAAHYGDISESEYQNVCRIYDLYTNTEGVTEGIEQLAHEITDPYDNDFDKANAIVDYFMTNGYIYDIDYIPEDESIDYFLFESKTGICTSYASSMVLMARAVGLPARYVEGFAVFEKNEEEERSFIVRDSHAHAFVEVFIPGVGWVTFDPTVPDYKDQQMRQGGGNAAAIRTFIDYFSRIVLFLGVVFVLVFIVFLDRIVELIFRIRYRFTKKNSDKAQLMYRRILRLLEVSAGRSVRVRGMTPYEVLELAKSRGAEISRAVEIFEKAAFGGYEPADVETEAAYSCYKQSWKALAGKLKKQKAKLGTA